MDYSKMCDFEINQKVGDMALNGRWACKPGSAGNETNNWQYGSGDPSLSLSSLPDYCNNPADAWTIIVENEISLNSYSGTWEASYEYDAPIGVFGTDELVTKSVEGRNPLRTAMIAYLMKQESANVQDNPAR